MVGATVKDGLSGKKTDVYARSVVNAAGPFSDEVRSLSQVRAARQGRASLLIAGACWFSRSA